ncbi:MAG: hypothetical protein H6688_01365 [Erysipelotrichaceae bacterium]|nr:hypothetical protein [Erysipelotrichaceae bacterium]
MDFKSHLLKYLKKDEIDRLMNSLTENDRHAALLNPRKMNDETFIQLFPHVIPHPLVPHAYLYDKSEYELGKTVEHELGAFYLQEPSAMVVSSLLDFHTDDLVLDLCAAPGGKTVQASFLMDGKGLIVANDIAHNRAMTIKENVERLGLGNILIISNDFSKIYHRYENVFDKIILDAPCSGSGMFRKDNRLKEDWTYAKVLKNQALQKELILMAYQMLKPGGVLSYSTCSFSYEEDEEIITYLLENTSANLCPIPMRPGFYQSPSKIGIHLLPYLFPGEGHYICHINKPNTLYHNQQKEKIILYKDQVIPSCPLVLKYGDFLFGISEKFDISSLSVIRYGVKIGEIKNNIIKYDVHYARYLSSFSLEKEIDEQSLINYRHGDSLSLPMEKGFVLLKYHSLSVDIAKSDGRIIKNRYPKYWRK